jgi:hypothetical protein
MMEGWAVEMRRQIWERSVGNLKKIGWKFGKERVEICGMGASDALAYVDIVVTL